MVQLDVAPHVALRLEDLATLLLPARYLAPRVRQDVPVKRVTATEPRATQITTEVYHIRGGASVLPTDMLPKTPLQLEGFIAKSTPKPRV